MKYWVGITDRVWFDYLRALQPDEVNFWQPSCGASFQAIETGAPFLFKLHSPNNFIVGGGFFLKYSQLPLSLSWDAFQNKNGASSYSVFKNAILKYRKGTADDPLIGCIILSSPFFFEESQWIPTPEDWSPNIVRGKTYDTSSPTGQRIWEQVLARLQQNQKIQQNIAEPVQRFGREYLVTPRIGQGGFRITVTDAYNRRCAVTGEKTLPALEAAHIKPFSLSGPHSINNGILLRADLHKLFDSGYVTITSGYKVEVSRKIREKYENGRDYYAMHGNELRNLPKSLIEYPSEEYIRWHNEQIFLG